MKQKILIRLSFIFDLIEKYQNSKRKEYDDYYMMDVDKYDVELYEEILLNCKSLIKLIYGKDSPHYKEFTSETFDFSEFNRVKGLLNVIKYEIENDWLLSIKALIAGEIFTDFLEMAQHFIENNYKDAAAIIIGSTLENHIKQLSTANNNSIHSDNGRPKTMNLINEELVKLNVYNRLENANVTSILAIRNQAAHGNYNEYNIGQVELMLENVKGFILRNPIST